MNQPSAAVVRRNGNCNIIIGVDLGTNETNSDRRIKSMAIAKFGFRCFRNPSGLNFGMVQLGWIVGEVGDTKPNLI